MQCNSNIVTCLRNDWGIFPTVTSSNTYTLSEKLYPINGIDYDKDTSSYYVHIQSSSEYNWWMVDYKKIVYINKFRIWSHSVCYWVNEWTIEGSLNNITWNSINSSKSYPDNNNITTDAIHVLRYAQITGRAGSECDKRSILAFLRIYFYGAIPPNGQTCLHRSYVHLSFLHFCIFMK